MKNDETNNDVGDDDDRKIINSPYELIMNYSLFGLAEDI